MRGPLLPSARAAATWSISLTPCTALWVTRAKPGTVLIPTATTTFPMPGPSALTTAMASRNPGNARITSTSRMSASSRPPPFQAATMPTRTPAPAAMRQAPSAIPSEMRAPYRTRERMSRPSSSRPKTWAHDGPVSAPSRCCLSASRGASQGPRAAIDTNSATMTSPATAARLRRNRRQAARPGLVLDPGVGINVEDVGDEVHEHRDERHQQDRALDHGKVPHADRFHEQPADPGEREDGLHQHGAGEDEPELQGHHRDDGQERVPQRVAQHDQRLGDALGPRRPDVVLLQHVHHA